jgi:hypothetical protein
MTNTDTNPTTGDGARLVGPRPDQAAVVDAYGQFLRRSCRPDGWDAVALLSANLEAATILIAEAHAGCTAPACPTCIPLRHATAYLFAFNLWVARS